MCICLHIDDTAGSMQVALRAWFCCTTEFSDGYLRVRVGQAGKAGGHWVRSVGSI